MRDALQSLFPELNNTEFHLFRCGPERCLEPLSSVAECPRTIKATLRRSAVYIIPAECTSSSPVSADTNVHAVAPSTMPNWTLMPDCTSSSLLDVLPDRHYSWTCAGSSTIFARKYIWVRCNLCCSVSILLWQMRCEWLFVCHVCETHPVVQLASYSLSYNLLWRWMQYYYVGRNVDSILYWFYWGTETVQVTLVRITLAAPWL